MTSLDRDDDGRPFVLPPGHPLSELLAAATAPGTPQELTGEEAAVAAFRAASGRAGRGSWWGRMLTLKVAAAAVATVATFGGVAMAASMGAPQDPVVPAAPVPVASTASVPPAASRPTPSVTTTPPRRAPSAAPAPSRTSACPSTRVRDNRWRDRRKRLCRDVRPRRNTHHAGDRASGGSGHGERAVHRAPHRGG